MGKAVIGRAQDRLAKRVGIPIDELDHAALGSRMRQPLLVLHDRGDREVLFDEGTQVVASWPGATLQATEGLGHNRIVGDPEVVRHGVAFLRSHVRG